MGDKEGHEVKKETLGERHCGEERSFPKRTF